MYISCLGTNSHRVKSTLIVPSIKISNSPGNFICATAGQKGAFEWRHANLLVLYGQINHIMICIVLLILPPVVWILVEPQKRAAKLYGFNSWVCHWEPLSFSIICQFSIKRDHIPAALEKLLSFVEIILALFGISPLINFSLINTYACTVYKIGYSKIRS